MSVSDCKIRLQILSFWHKLVSVIGTIVLTVKSRLLTCVYIFMGLSLEYVILFSGVSRMAYPGVQTEDGVLAPLGKLKNGAPRRRCWMGEGGSMLEVIISFSDNVIGIRLLKIALTLN